MPEAPAPGPVLSSTRTSRPDPRLRRASSIARCQPVERPWMPAPTTTYWTLSGIFVMASPLPEGTAPVCTTRPKGPSRQGVPALQGVEQAAEGLGRLDRAPLAIRFGPRGPPVGRLGLEPGDGRRAGRRADEV